MRDRRRRAHVILLSARLFDLLAAFAATGRGRCAFSFAPAAPTREDEGPDDDVYA
jgi:hypothetical protein